MRFSAFSEDALVRIDPEEISKKGRVPKNGSIFFTIFQTFMSGTDAKATQHLTSVNIRQIFLILSSSTNVIAVARMMKAIGAAFWNTFAPAVQLGLTATPKRKDNVDTYAYFGEPVYIYSLKEGINDGFLTPFKVKQIATTLDEYIYTPDDGVMVQGEVEPGQTI